MKPVVTNVMAVSVDGKIGLHSHESDEDRQKYGFSNNDDKEWVRSLLENCDAVVTGANSLRASGSTWEVKNNLGKNPAWIVITTKGIDKDFPFWTQSNVRRVLVSPVPIQQTLCASSGVENWVIQDANPSQAILNRLERENLLRVLLFGGGSINKMFYEKGLVDFAKITKCPLIVGGVNSSNFVDPGLPLPINFALETFFAKGSLLFLNYRVIK